MKIHLFGATTPSGQALINNISLNFPDWKVYSYSRSKTSKYMLDLKKPDSFFPNDDSQDGSYWVSFAPIWILESFLRNLYIYQQDKLKYTKRIIVCSSSSVITKRLETNKFDKNLVNRLRESEKSILQICNELDISCKIIRPTLIYGQAGKYKDRNLSQIVKLMRLFIFLPIPKDTGERQPIHAKQLANVSLKLIQNSNESISKENNGQFINLGGDSTISYQHMLLALQNALPKSDPGRKCYLISIPNSIFFFLVSPLLLFSPKIFAAIKRVSANLSGFTPSHKILKIEPEEFPLNPIAK